MYKHYYCKEKEIACMYMLLDDGEGSVRARVIQCKQ